MAASDRMSVSALGPVLFDQPQTANGLVPWHRDRLIAVSERHGSPEGHVRLAWDQAHVPADAVSSSTVITGSPGSVLLMRPLLLHASSPAIRPVKRRVEPLEYCAMDLPAGLDWHQRLR